VQLSCSYYYINHCGPGYRSRRRTRSPAAWFSSWHFHPSINKSSDRFQYWNNPGALAREGLVNSLPLDRFLALLSVLVQAAYSFQGVEIVRKIVFHRCSTFIVGYRWHCRLLTNRSSFCELILVSTAAETESPRRNIGKAVRRVFWRIIIFYVRCFRSHPKMILYFFQILGIIIAGMVVPYDDPSLLNCELFH
jgi:yeast amino acid transporter